MTIDLTMCSDTCCPVKEHCLRSPASGTTAHPHQAWYMGSPRTLAGCGHFEPESPVGRRTFQAYATTD